MQIESPQYWHHTGKLPKNLVCVLSSCVSTRVSRKSTYCLHQRTASSSLVTRRAIHVGSFEHFDEVANHCNKYISSFAASCNWRMYCTVQRKVYYLTVSSKKRYDSSTGSKEEELAINSTFCKWGGGLRPTHHILVDTTSILKTKDKMQKRATRRSRTYQQYIKTPPYFYTNVPGKLIRILRVHCIETAALMMYTRSNILSLIETLNTIQNNRQRTVKHFSHLFGSSRSF